MNVVNRNSGSHPLIQKLQADGIANRVNDRWFGSGSHVKGKNLPRSFAFVTNRKKNGNGMNEILLSPPLIVCLV